MERNNREVFRVVTQSFDISKKYCLHKNTQKSHLASLIYIYLIQFLVIFDYSTCQMTSFIRPSDLPFPTIYHKFQAKDKDSDEIVEYRIQDLLEEDYEKGIDMMISEYCPDESFNRCRGVSDNPEAIKEKRMIWRKHVDKKLSVGCYKTDVSNELVGICIFSVHVKNESESPFLVRINVFFSQINSKIMFFL